MQASQRTAVDQTPQAGPSPPQVRPNWEVGRVFVLGVTFFMVLVVAPLLETGGAISATLAWPLLVLLYGAITGYFGHKGAFGWLVLVAFPVATTVVSLQVNDLDRVLSPWKLIVVAATLFALVASALALLGPVYPVRDRRVLDLGLPKPLTKPASSPWVRTVFFVIVAFGSAAIAAGAPHLGEPDDFERAWGEAARQAATLTAVLGGAVAVTVVAAFVGPALRTQKAADIPTKALWRRMGLYGLITLLSGFVYLALWLWR